MEELEQYLEASAQDIEGVKMVPLSAALQAMQTASNVEILESLDNIMADLQKTITDANLTSDFE